jgi:predicted dehydrogenase
VVADPEVDLVYNALVNSLHARWNLAALDAGKHVLSEKPITCNATEARAVRAAAGRSQGTIVEGLHYLHHPVSIRLHELVASGDLGDVERVELVLATPAPPDTDPRWTRELGGGATLDIGCYVLSAARHVGRWVGAGPKVVSADARLKGPDVDAGMRVSLAYGGGLTADCVWDMNAEARTMTWTVHGSWGSATSPAFAVPHMDNRVVTSIGGREASETLGDQTSYTYQLAALARTIEAGEPFPVDIDDALANAELMDACFRQAGLDAR